MAVPDRVTVVEVGPRDGLQNEDALVPTAAKVLLIEELARCGLTVVEAAARIAEVVNAIRSLHIPEITSVRAADLFRGKNVPAGKFSLMIRVTLQSREATLTDAQIADCSSRIIAALERSVGAHLRAS